MIAIDLGSNSFRAIEYDEKSGEFRNEYERFVKLADGLSTSKLIKKDAVDRVIKAINESKKVLDFTNNRVSAVTTAAMRIAQNSAEIIETILNFNRIDFKLLMLLQKPTYTLNCC